MIAASTAKGIWVVGLVSLGYLSVDKASRGYPYLTAAAVGWQRQRGIWFSVGASRRSLFRKRFLTAKSQPNS